MSPSPVPYSMVTHHLSQSTSEEMRTPNAVGKWSCLMGRQRPWQKNLYLKPMEKRCKSQWWHPWYYSTGWVEEESWLERPHNSYLSVYPAAALTWCINHIALSLPKPDLPTSSGSCQTLARSKGAALWACALTPPEGVWLWKELCWIRA